jgi:anti-anti-sigma factor
MNTRPDNPQSTPKPYHGLRPVGFEIRIDSDTGAAGGGSERSRLITVLGEVDMHTAGQLADAIARVSGSTVVDLSGVTFIDSHGIEGLLLAKGTARRHGHQMIVRNPSTVVRRVLDLAGVSDLLMVEDQQDLPPR